jgi:hypothetical protein
VKSSKVGGQSVGFIIEDARGDKYLLKFDEIDFPVMETATDVVVQRLLWAVGYNTPEDQIVYFDRDRLVLTEESKIKDVFGHERPMTVEDLDGELAKVRSENGRFRGLTSRFLPGIPIGGFPQRGVRADDPNDTIPHEHRRELRGLRVVYGWLQYTDAKENNTLDVYVEDPADENRHYVVHYLVDFGKSLGANANMSLYYQDGHSYMIDMVDIPGQILSFGLVHGTWEGTHDPGIEGVAMFDVDHFDVGGFVPHDPYEPFLRIQDQDGFWAAKILARFRPDQIRAAVEQGKYQDPRAVDYLTEVLHGRARKAARYWFRRVAPLDRFTVSKGPGGHRLCFEDLELVHRLGGRPGQTTYAAATFDEAGAATGWRQSLPGDPTGVGCFDGIQPSAGADGYVIARIALTRGKSFDPVVVHMATDPATGALRIIGVRRQ